MIKLAIIKQGFIEIWKSLYTKIAAFLVICLFIGFLSLSALIHDYAKVFLATRIESPPPTGFLSNIGIIELMDFVDKTFVTSYDLKILLDDLKNNVVVLNSVILDTKDLTLDIWKDRETQINQAIAELSRTTAEVILLKSTLNTLKESLELEIRNLKSAVIEQNNPSEQKP